MKKKLFNFLASVGFHAFICVTQIFLAPPLFVKVISTTLKDFLISTLLLVLPFVSNIMLRVLFFLFSFSLCVHEAYLISACKLVG